MALDRRKFESSGQVRPRGHNLGFSQKKWWAGWRSPRKVDCCCFLTHSSTWGWAAEAKGGGDNLIFNFFDDPSWLDTSKLDDTKTYHYQVFLHLRHISDLCNSLPLETESGQPLELKCSSGSHLNTSGKISLNQKPSMGGFSSCDLMSKDNDNQQKRSSGVYDFTPTNKQRSKEGLGREPSLACEVSSYFQEQ